MMRSLYSGVAGLKVHQTRMDVIGNNIANVNTIGFKSSNANFSDTFYQTISSASGANVETGVAGTNAKQIGLGALVASITTNITGQGGTQNTDRSLDIAINGEAFLIVNSNGVTYFTKSGALNIDEAGILYCTTNGATVMGWLANDDGEVVKDTVKELRIKTADTMYVPPTATEKITMKGNIDKNDPNVQNTGEEDAFTTGLVMTFGFYDNLGEEYLVKFVAQKDPETEGVYKMKVSDILNSKGKSIFVSETENDGATEYATTAASVTIGEATFTAESVDSKGRVKLSDSTFDLVFNGSTGNFNYVGAEDQTSVQCVINSGNEAANPFRPEGLEIDFSTMSQYASGGVANTTYEKGIGGEGTGNYAGNMIGISIDDKGMIYGVYDNGESKCLGQIAVATFPNPSGLEAKGSSLFATTLNSGDFDGVGTDISSVGDFTVGALEMSNVDLATEFTTMITTQRGFQANSRIITTSDSMLEELVNLKR